MSRREKPRRKRSMKPEGCSSRPRIRQLLSYQFAGGLRSEHLIIYRSINI